MDSQATRLRCSPQATPEGIAVFGAAEYLAMSDSSATVSGKGGLRIAF